MKSFSVTISNPPYSSNSHATGSKIYDKFIELQYELTEDNGELITVHPPGFRKPSSPMRRILTHNQVHKLSMHSAKEGQKVFGASTSYDVYSLTKQKRTKPTEVKFIGSDDWIDLDLSSLPFIPNSNIEILLKFLSTDSSIPRLKFKKGTAIRHKGRTSGYDPIVEHKSLHKNLFKIVGNKLSYCYTVKREPGSAEKKVVVSENGKFEPYYDDGQYRCSDQLYYVEVQSKEEADSIISYLKSDEAELYRESCLITGGFRIDHQMLSAIPNPYYLNSCSSPHPEGMVTTVSTPQKMDLY